MYRIRITGDLGFEYWKDIDGYEGLYQISTYGRVKSLGNGVSNNSCCRILKDIKSNGYHNINIILYKKSIPTTYKIHRLVAASFFPKLNCDLNEVNHKDENKSNNRVENLEWCNRKYNVNYGTRIKRVVKANTNGKCSKPVIQYDLQGTYIKEWDSLNEIERILGFSHSLICNYCNGKRKTAYGFIWRYKKEVE